MLIIQLILTFFLIFLNLIISLTPLNEINTLELLYNYTNGTNWRWRGSIGKWNFNLNKIDPCGNSWQGIECTSTSINCILNTCNILKIDLNHYNLIGSLPNNLSNLKLLTSLDLSSNKITGQLPLYLPLSIQIFRIQVNKLTGILPEQLGYLTNLHYIDLETNQIGGKIPSSIGNMSLLEIFACDRNNLTSTLPTSLSQLKNLRRLDLEKNDLSGIIPNEIYYITKLHTLDLSRNRISGTISSMIGKLTYLTYLDLCYNYINGSIPNEIENLLSLELLRLSVNSLSSTIPSGIWMLNNLTYLDLSYNSLKDTLPNNFNLLKNIRSITLQRNQLYGIIPSNFGSMITLVNIDLSSNYFDKTLPNEISNLSNLLTLEISNNLLTGTLPTSLGGLKSLTWFELQDNYFTGQIPIEIGLLIHLRYIILKNSYLSGILPCNSLKNLTDLTYFDISYNSISGTLCSEFGYLGSIENIYLTKNYLTGSIPSFIGYMSSLQILELSNNKFKYHIPTTIGNLTELVVLSLSNNEFSGLIPSQLGLLTQLEQLYLQKNNFNNNNFKQIFWQATNLHLINIDISSNHFSGIIPKEIFLLPYIETIAMTSNCFTGTLPKEICQANYLNVLSMDGLGAGKDCKIDLSTIYSKWRYTWGNIPKCIWLMKNLTVLSLSGNGFSGTINNILFDSKLINLTLSHNHLSGTIPITLQTHSFDLLDLSYNKFTGETLNLITPLNMSYSRIFEVNRLSGDLNSIKIIKSNYDKTINILDGNIFGCHQLPKDDVHYSTYICGSQEYDSSLTIFGGIIILLFLFISFILLLKFMKIIFYSHLNDTPLIHNFLELFYKLYQYYSFFDSSSELLDEIQIKTKTINELKAFSHSFRYMQTSVIFVMLVGFICCLPLYILKGLNSENNEDNHGNYRTHYHLYRWMWTLAFIRGELPAGLLLLAWILSSCVLMININIMVNQQFKEQLIPNTNSIRLSRSLSSQSELQSRSRSESRLFSLSLLLSPFKSTTPSSPPSTTPSSTPRNIMFYLESYLNDQKLHELFMIGMVVIINISIVGTVNGFYIYSTIQNLNESLHFWIEILVSIFKIIWNSWMLPFMLRKYKLSRLPTLLAKLTLFNNIFIPCLATAFTSTSCFQGVIVQSKEITSTYTYSACYSYIGLRRVINGEYISWCAGYTDVTVSVEPFHPKFNYNNLCGSSILKAYIPIYLYIYSITLIFPPICLYILARYTSYESIPKWMRQFVPAILWPLASEETLRDSVSSVNSKDPITSASMLFKRDNIAVSLMQHISLLITFGLCSPILGIAIVLVTCFSITQWSILIARFVIIRKEHNQTTKDEVLESLNSIIGDTAVCFKSMLWIVLWTSCLFFAFLCWDISADVVGWIPSIWIPITAFLSLPLIWFCFIFSYYSINKDVFNGVNERIWSKSFLSSETGSNISILFPSTNESITNRSSEFGEVNPLRGTEIEMIRSQLAIREEDLENSNGSMNYNNNNNNNNHNNTNESNRHTI